MATWRPERVRCDLRVDPLGVQSERPVLDWRLPGATTGYQTAYQVVVASTVDQLGSDADLWDSGWVESTVTQVVYGGPPPRSRQKLWWAVRVRDGSGSTSDWSGACFWEMGLLVRSDWAASWIRRSERGHQLPDRAVYLFRRSFNLNTAPQRARAYVTALGAYELLVNGRAVGESLLRPGWTAPHRRLQYQVVDLGGHLNAGGNVVGAALAPGWFAGRISSEAASEDNSHCDVRTPELLAQLEIEGANGARMLIVTDESWWWASSAIVSSDLYDGEDWDCRLLRPGWAGGAETDVGPWQRAELSTGTSGALVAERGAPLRVRLIEPAQATWRHDGSVLLDSGRNDTGFIRLRVREPRGRKVEVSYGEVVDAAGNLYRDNLRGARCMDNFVCAGGGEEQLAPSFSYRGYRYAEVRGLSGEASLVGAEAVAIGSAMERTGRFRSSNQFLEQMYEMMVCSLDANYIEVPTDCPQRDERLGWMADALLFAPVAAYTYDINAFMSKWFDDVLDARTAEGGFSDIAPRPSARWSHRPATGAPAWADAGVLLPWLMYERYGDRELLERTFPAMRSWLELVHAENSDGIWRSGRGNDYGDWVPAGPDTSHDLFSTTWLYRSSSVGSQVAELLGETSACEWLAERAETVRRAFLQHYVDTSTGRVRDPEAAGSSAARRFAPVLAAETQTGYVMALAFGLLTGDLAHKAGRRLAGLVVNAGRRLETGFAGSAFLLSALEQAGSPGLAYDLLLRQEPPSLGFMASLGATSVWERWDGLDARGWPACPNMNSFNHYAMSSMLSWLVEGVCGLRPTAGEPAMGEVRFAPALSRRVRDAGFDLAAPVGPLALTWQWQGDDRVVGSIQVPPGMRCTIATTVAVDDDLAGGVEEGTKAGRPWEPVVGAGEHEVVWQIRS